MGKWTRRSREPDRRSPQPSRQRVSPGQGSDRGGDEKEPAGQPGACRGHRPRRKVPKPCRFVLYSVAAKRVHRKHTLHSHQGARDVNSEREKVTWTHTSLVPKTLKALRGKS